ncbi:MAG: tRNA uridine-5-carboxymethylaminomethyl(34) synthesis GTPase MnmE [Rickettsiaceae bacterium]|nr:tRNA uridine-5-carboxymethylaminomethyl(34) synthesis GTPase MnmE [Rickettsiaceae bacterium]
MDSIFAQSSAPGKAGVSVFRISGPSALEVAKILSHMDSFSPRRLTFTKLFDQDGSVIDHAMIVYFNSPHSFTGQDVVEIHTHGSIAISKLLSERVLSTGLVRYAEPGEFARRAFINGKMDLTMAEGLADLIESETTMQHKQAMRQMGGELERLYSDLRAKLLKIISLLEAFIDFPDEEIPEDVLLDSESTIEELKAGLKSHLGDNRRGERLRNGIMLAILGEPNVGKSSLLNFLARREVAIVSNIAGTTRDVIESHLDIGGYPIIICDTAGLRLGTSDVIEEEGMRRAIKYAENADIKIIMFDVDNIATPSEQLLEMIDENTILLLNKVDKNQQIMSNYPVIPISIKNNQGLDLLLAEIEKKAQNLAMPSEMPSITRQRHRNSIEQALIALDRCDIRGDIVLAAEDIRIAIRQLSLLTGRIEVDEILGEIFSKFCIGK